MASSEKGNNKSSNSQEVGLDINIRRTDNSIKLPSTQSYENISKVKCFGATIIKQNNNVSIMEVSVD
jgi:hypothetical protein